MSYQHLLMTRSDHICTLTVNRPSSLNSLTPQAIDELIHAVNVLETDQDTKVVIMTGSGNKAFVAGGDISIMHLYRRWKREKWLKKHKNYSTTSSSAPKFTLLQSMDTLLVRDVNWRWACDIRIAAQEAQLGQPEVKLGIIPGWGGTQRLPRLVGKGKAKELMMTGRMIDASEAERIGLVNKVVPHIELLQEAQIMARQIAAQSQMAVRLIKEAVDTGLEMDIDKAFTYEADLFGLCFAGHDQKEGMKAFLEKRKAVWKDC